MKRVISWLLDLLYPPKCVICRRLLAAGETEICADCLEALPNFEGPAPQVDGCDVLCVTLFYEGAVRESFLRFKFSGRDFYADTYGKWMAGTICDKLGTGFDGICWVPALQKHAERGPQSQLKDAAQRRSNASGAFSVLPGTDVSGKTLLLIDDIVTTGATLSECCRVLKGAGAARVDCAAFASPRNENER